MTDEIFEAQENIMLITKQQHGFIRPPSKDLAEELGLEWV